MDESTRAGRARDATGLTGLRGLRGWLLGALLALAFCLASPLAAQAQRADEDPWQQGPLRGINIALDLILVRPLSVIGLAAGTALFVPAAIMTSPGGSDTIGEAWELFVLVPGAYVWEKPLGEL